MSHDKEPRYTIERTAESSGHCDCCGQTSHVVSGLVHSNGDAFAAYWMHWTDGHLTDLGANFDIVMGLWGDDTGPEDRYVVSLLHRQMEDGTPALMVIDAEGRPAAKGSLATTAKRRKDVIGTPLAQQVFALADAIYLQDGRFF